MKLFTEKITMFTCKDISRSEGMSGGEEDADCRQIFSIACVQSKFDSVEGMQTKGKGKVFMLRKFKVKEDRLRNIKTLSRASEISSRARLVGSVQIRVGNTLDI